MTANSPASNHIPLQVAVCTKLYYWCFPLYRAIYFIYKKFSDRAVIAHLRKVIAEKNLLTRGKFLDVGANIGFYSRFFAENTDPDAQIIAIEPEPRNFAHLRAESKNFAKIKIISAAVSDAAGEVALTLSPNSVIDHHLSALHTPPPSTRATVVPAVTLDEIGDSEQWARVDLIKMDIQGAECKALRGAKKLLARSPGCYIFMEFFPWGFARAGDSTEQFFALLRELNLVIVAPENFSLTEYARQNAQSPTAYTDVVLRVAEKTDER